MGAERVAFRSPLAALAIAAACTPVPDEFPCTLDGDCARESGPGTCEINGYCSFVDPSCAGTGHRYGRFAPKDIADQCVELARVVALHLPREAQSSGPGDLEVLGVRRIDTGELTLDGGAAPAETPFDVWSDQDVELAVLHARRLFVAGDGRLEVRGARPLIVLAGESVEISGLLEVSADGSTPGPGGLEGGAGPGAGRRGAEPEGATGSGGGGAGHGNAGASGGRIDVGDTAGGAGGGAYGDEAITILQGGSGGGGGGPEGCPVSGGAGGGALQISSGGAIRIGLRGAIVAGGGGGAGGCACAAGPGAGGGSGGAILLQAPTVEVRGVLAANGGAGGGACGGGPVAQPGGNGHPSAEPALGGAAGGQPASGAGGRGAARRSPAETGEDARDTGGGGGGAVGRIRLVSGELVITGTISPAYSP